MIARDMVVNAGVTLRENSVCTKLKYDSENKCFIEIDAEDKNLNNEELFESGGITYIPREFAL